RVGFHCFVISRRPRRSTLFPYTTLFRSTNQMRIVFANGSTLEHEFEVQISEPFVNSINNEYALVGEVATIRGNYFYEPLTVTFKIGRAHVSTLVWRNPIMPSAAKTKSIK